MAASVLIFILGAIVTLTFVIEISRMLISSSQVENGVDLAASGWVHKYGKELKEKTKTEYDKAKVEATLEVKALEAAGLVLTPDEEKEMINLKIKAIMLTKISTIKSAAKSACTSKIHEIISQNMLIFVSGECTETMVTVTGKTKYTPILGELHIGPSEMIRTIKKQIVITN